MAITLQNTASGAVFNGTPVTTVSASAINATSGNLIAVFVTYYYGVHGDPATTTITDTAGNTYTQVDTRDNGASQKIISFYAKNIVGNASNVVTATFSSNTIYTDIFVLQYSGLDTASPLDAHTTGTASASTSVTSSSFTTSQADEVIVAGAFDDTGGPLTAEAGYTKQVSVNNGGVEDKIVSSIQTGVTASMTGASGNWGMAVMTFKQAPDPVVTGNSIGLLLALTYHLTVTTSPGVISASFSIPTPTVRGAVNLSPSVVSSTFSIPTPTPSGAVNISPGVISATFSLPTPTVGALANINAGVQTSTFTVQAPSISAGVTLSPSAISGTFSVQTVTVTGGASVNAGVISLTFTVQAPTVSAGAVITAGVNVGTFSIPSHTASGASNTNALVLTISFSVPSPSVSAGANITPGILSLIASIPTPTITNGAMWTPLPKPTTAWVASNKPTTSWTNSSKPTSIWTPVSKPPLES
jgi:hypothetical protein